VCEVGSSLEYSRRRVIFFHFFKNPGHKGEKPLLNMNQKKMGYIVKKDEVRPELMKELDVTPMVFGSFGGKKPESFRLYQEEEDKYIVPKFWAIERMRGGEPFLYDSAGSLITAEFIGELRDYQQEVADAVLPKIRETGGGIISLPCGDGKTCLAIYLMTQLKLKTLVICHKNFLVNQWIESIKKFSNATIGRIQQNTVDVEGKDVVIGMLQSLSKKDYHHSILDQFDLVIFDEVHNVATKCFSKVLAKLYCRYTIGLSATPHRDDGLSKVFHWYLGDMLFKRTRAKDSGVTVQLLGFSPKGNFHPKFREIRNNKGDVNLSLMLSNVAGIQERNEKIIESLVEILRKEPSRNVLVLSSRIDQLESMKKMFEGSGYTSDFYVGKMKEAQLKIAQERQVLFATYEMVNEGFDLPKLNTLVMATPRSKIEQAVGRILRARSEAAPPLIVDVVDALPIFKNQSAKRNTWYRGRGYKIITMGS